MVSVNFWFFLPFNKQKECEKVVFAKGNTLFDLADIQVYLKDNCLKFNLQRIFHVIYTTQMKIAFED